MKTKRIILITALTASVLAGRGQEKRSASYAGHEGQFQWQFPGKDKEKEYRNYSYSIDRWWGDFPKGLKAPADLFGENPWAIGPIVKYKKNPVLAPSPGAWDQGHFSGGVHNGSILVKDGVFYYIYRGERPIDIPKKSSIDYICDIGVATSRDGIHFTKSKSSPFFRKGEDRKYSYEDVNVVRYGDVYYLFCNQWLWGNTEDHRVNGTFLATSKDLLHWKKVGIIFPNAKRTHRNAVILQNPNNEAVRVNGKFVMYINFGLMAYSDDMVHWESKEVDRGFPNEECCFALADYDAKHPGNMILFTGGPHTGHFYAVGEMLYSKKDPEKPVAYLHRPALAADSTLPYEHGFTATAPHKLVSSYADCIFFNGLTRYKGKWWFYYGGSEYYTCLANAEAGKE
jgi:predicted GH43/DUF377 family glycosyl hydrolase